MLPPLFFCNETNVILAEIRHQDAKVRQTALCKHFTRTGRCPLGDACHLYVIVAISLYITSFVRSSIHDLTLGMVDKGKGTQVEPHCWAHVQGGCCVRSCQYFHPYDIRPCEFPPSPRLISTDSLRRPKVHPMLRLEPLS